MSRLTAHGFRIGALEVTRAAEYDGYAVVFIDTATERIEVTATPKGRFMRTLRYRKDRPGYLSEETSDEH